MRLPEYSLKPKKLSLQWPIIIRRIHGHSMLPGLPPGTHILGFRWFRKLPEDCIIIFTHDGREKIKRISEIDNDKLYVLGDHPDASTDSRHFGWISRRQVIARVIWPSAPPPKDPKE